jgi:hypothetical protein
MNTIKFSHIYLKMRGLKLPHYAELLEVFIKKRENLSTAFVGYDTAFVEKKNQISHYPLPSEGEMLVLLLRDDEGNLFTTIRRSTPRKKQYYLGQRGKRFQLKLLPDR